mgnify:CR=1 FL=1
MSVTVYPITILLFAFLVILHNKIKYMNYAFLTMLIKHSCSNLNTPCRISCHKIGGGNIDFTVLTFSENINSGM